LEKDPTQRFQSARDLAFALEAVVESRSSGATSSVSPVSSGLRLAVPWIVAATLAAALGLNMCPKATLAPLPRVQFDIETPATPGANQIALSPTGTHLATVSAESGGMVWVRGLDNTVGQTIQGSEGATWPFWSADGQTIGFFANGKLRRVELQGGFPSQRT
jgi:hypothetical protein